MKIRPILLFLAVIFTISVGTWTTIEWLENRKPKEWTEEQIELWIDNCISSSKYLSSADSAVGHEICECMIEKLIEEYSYEEIWELSEQKNESSMEIMSPIAQNCLFPTLYRENHTVINDTSQLKWICDSIVDTWEPTDNDLRIAESILETAIEENYSEYWTLLSVKTAKKYYRQYSFIVDKSGNKIVYINAFCDVMKVPVDSAGVRKMRPFDWENGFLMVCDGGDCYWSIHINLTTMSYSKFIVNGHA